MQEPSPVVIIGAGIAGLAAALKLAEAGVQPVVIEARDRIGGRMFTRRDADGGLPIELGAEFIHGLIPEIFEPLQSSGVPIIEADGDSWCAFDRTLAPCDFFSQVDSILSAMDDSGPDEPFLDFLDREFPEVSGDHSRQRARARAIGYVSGFNAADPALVGAHWLVAGMRAESQHEGHRAFRAKGGYADFLEILRKRLETFRVRIQTGTVVERIKWKAGAVEVYAVDKSGPCCLTAQRVLVTLPISILRLAQGRGAVKFIPALPPEKRLSFEHIEMGKVIRITLRFRNRFWETLSPALAKGTKGRAKTLNDLSFLLSDNEFFPTWWTRVPVQDPVITGWAPFQSAERLSGRPELFITHKALQTLANLLQLETSTLEHSLVEACLHDWQQDPFSRGAYSYGKVGALGAQRALALPVQDTLFFAGEATDLTGNNGTVHGAIISAHRAAAEILLAGHRP